MTSRASRLLSLAVGVSLVVVSCGSDDDSIGSVGTPSGSSTSTTTTSITSAAGSGVTTSTTSATIATTSPSTAPEATELPIVTDPPEPVLQKQRIVISEAGEIDIETTTDISVVSTRDTGSALPYEYSAPDTGHGVAAEVIDPTSPCTDEGGEIMVGLAAAGAVCEIGLYVEGNERFDEARITLFVELSSQGIIEWTTNVSSTERVQEGSSVTLTITMGADSIPRGGGFQISHWPNDLGPSQLDWSSDGRTGTAEFVFECGLAPVTTETTLSASPGSGRYERRTSQQKIIWVVEETDCTGGASPPESSSTSTTLP